jgi:hypothetical protein
MSIIETNITDSFNQWRLNTNQIGNDVGDMALLDTTDKTSLVDAVNEVNDATSTLAGTVSSMESSIQAATDNAVVMAIALG